jgi:hypothetical protein
LKRNLNASPRRCLLERNPGLLHHIPDDELQTPTPPWRLVTCLRRPSDSFAVGDINQSIYASVTPRRTPSSATATACAIRRVLDALPKLPQPSRILPAGSRLKAHPAGDCAPVRAPRFQPCRRPVVRVIAASAMTRTGREGARPACRPASRPLWWDRSRRRGWSRAAPRPLLSCACCPGPHHRALPPLESAFREAGIPTAPKAAVLFYKP